MFKNFYKTNVFINTVLTLLTLFLVTIHSFLKKNINIVYLLSETTNTVSIILDGSVFKLSLVTMLVFTFLFIFFINKSIFKRKTKHIVTLTYLTILISSVLMILTESTLTFLVYYELVLIPSVFLVYSHSPNKRSFVTSVYFLL